MNKELPYIDEQGQLHYEAYFGKGRAFLRSALPTSHPEHLYNYLKNHGIDWTLFFEEDGRRKGIDHEHGPVEKLLGLNKENNQDLLESVEFYDLMQQYRIAPMRDQDLVIRCFNRVKDWIRRNKITRLDRDSYTRADMERAFAAGGANAAKERVSDNKLTLPVLEFDQWLEKYKAEKRFSDQARGRMERKGQSTPVVYEIINSGDIDKTVIDLLNKKQKFIHEIIAEVVMLPTSRASHLYAIEKGGKTTLYFEEYPSKNVNAGNQHLYFLSNEKPKKGDWAISKPSGKVYQVGDPEYAEQDGDMKIIATTDHSLRMKMPTRDGFPYEFPSPKDEFLFLYIGAHNTGRPVKEVSIEAELLCCQTGAPCGMPCNGDCEKNAVKSMVIDITNTINNIAV